MKSIKTITLAVLFICNASQVAALPIDPKLPSLGNTIGNSMGCIPNPGPTIVDHAIIGITILAGSYLYDYWKSTRTQNSEIKPENKNA
jgi:hypothetical protein